MASATFFEAFQYEWAQTGNTFDWQDDQYKLGWATIGPTPPSVEQFNRVHQIADEKANWLYAQLETAATAKGITLSAGDLGSLEDLLTAYVPVQATETVAGIAEVATQAEVLAGTDDARFVTPLKLFENSKATRGQQVFSTPGVATFNRPAGVSKVRVRVWGAGGGGASDVSSTPGPTGGAEGGYWEGVFDLTSSPTVSVTVGTGGAGATGIGLNGSPGTATSFGSFCSAQGGGGGIRTGNSPGGGTATGTSGFGWRGGFGFAPVSAGAGFFGGAGGGGWSPFAITDTLRPEKPGAGGGGRINSAAAPGAHGSVIIDW